MLSAIALAAVELGAGFTGASATVEDHDASTFVVDLWVVVEVGSGPVVAHLGLPGGEEETAALVERSRGVWGTVVELRRADWRVVFESLATGALSQPASLSSLGLASTLVTDSGGPGLGARDPGAPWGALSLGCATAAVILAGFALIGDGRSAGPRHLRRSTVSRRSDAG